MPGSFHSSSCSWAPSVPLFEPLWHNCVLEFLNWIDVLYRKHWLNLCSWDGRKSRLHNGEPICNILLTAAFRGSESSWRNHPESLEPLHAFQGLTNTGRSKPLLGWAYFRSMHAAMCMATKQHYLKTRTRKLWIRTKCVHRYVYTPLQN